MVITSNVEAIIPLELGRTFLKGGPYNSMLRMESICIERADARIGTNLEIVFQRPPVDLAAEIVRAVAIALEETEAVRAIEGDILKSKAF